MPVGPDAGADERVRRADIYCFVRSETPELGLSKLQNNLQSYGIWQEQFRGKIMPVIGDLSQPLLGLDEGEFQNLACEVDVIYHSGALLHYTYPYSQFKPVNVLGTQEVLRLASTGKVKPVHYVSTLAVFESAAYSGKVVTELDPLEHSEEMYLGYSQSKWVAEKLVKIAGERGLPISIYRPPLISGHSQTGVWNTDDIFCRIIKGCIQMVCRPDLDIMWDMSPVDYVSQSMVYLSHQKESFGKAFHLNNPQPIPWNLLFDMVKDFGYPLQKISLNNWQTQLERIDRENPLYPLMPFFLTRRYDKQLTGMEMYEEARRPKVSCEKTQAALAGSSITCPPIDDKVLKTYLSYFTGSGFLKLPEI
ncbi:MAG: thioester reductase domain-containing protein [Oscillatoria princeps RMCB-10]|nr:thioester reductase domain-containing protein [Oscillatoria princeps RMCB-10]